MNIPRKAGRPTTNPKNRRVQAKLDEETDAILMEYCRAHQLTESEAIRCAIRLLSIATDEM